MAVCSTQCQNRAVRSTQGGRGVSPSNKVVLLYTEVESIVFVNEAKTMNADVVSNINERISFGRK